MKDLQISALVHVYLLVGLSLAVPTVVAANDLAPPEAYATMSEIRNVAISPSGKFLAYQIFEDGENLVLVFDMSSGSVVLSSDVDDSYLRSIRFVNDEFVALVYDMDPWANNSLSSFMSTHDGGMMIVRGPGTVRHRRTRFLDLRETSVQKNYIAGATGDIVRVAPDLGAVYLPWKLGALVRYTIDPGTRSPSLASGSSDTLDWYMSDDSEPLVREDFDLSKERHIVYVYKKGEESVLLDEEVRGRDIDVVALSPQQDSLIFLTRRPGLDDMTYHEMNLADGSRSGPLFSQSIGQILTDSGKTAFGFERDSFPGYEYVFLDKKAEEFFRSIEARLPGLDVRYVASTDDFERMVVRVSKNWGAAHYLFFSNGDPQPVIIGQDNRAISSEQSMPRSLLEFNASDGRPIRAYLTMPVNGTPAGDAPLIVLSNGSLHAYQTRRYQWLAQYFASRGYVVVQPGERGLDYGPEFMPSSDDSWGDMYESDINDTIQYLVDKGVTDAARTCIIGINIGGYAAMSSAAQSPDKYRCVVTVSGLSDLSLLFDRSRENRGQFPQLLSYFETVFGISGKEKDAIKNKSPQNRVESDYPPSLLVYFKGGDSIFYYSMKDMHRALNKKGVPATLLRLPGFNFQLSELEARPVMLKSISKFVEEHI